MKILVEKYSIIQIKENKEKCYNNLPNVTRNMLQICKWTVHVKETRDKKEITSAAIFCVSILKRN